MNKTIKNVIATAACADAFAMPLMTRSPQLIRQDLGDGSLVKELIAPPADCPGYEFQKGSVTDSFASAYCLLKSFLNNGVSYESTVAGLLDFKYGETSRYYDVFASGTDRYSMEFIEGTHVFNRFDKVPCEHRRHSNEAASRAF